MTRAIRFLRERLGRTIGFSGRQQRGQALIIVILSIFGLLVLVGLAVDLGLFYIERVRITRAVDAAALAGAAELPVEEAAHERALDFLVENGYDPYDVNTQLIINPDGSVPEDEDAWTIVVVDTAHFRDLELDDPLNSAYRIQVQVTRRVPVILLQFVGFRTLSVHASATAENINNLDIAIVFDKSGSMEFNTLCYGCWEPMDDGIPPYPSGTLYPLPWRGDADGPPEHCGPTQVYEYGGEDYYFIEAEEYSYVTTEPDYHLAHYSMGQSYWVLQRKTARSPNSASGRDGRGAYIMHMPYPDMEHADGPGVTCRYEEVANGGNCWPDAPGGPYPAPRVDYEFRPLEDGDYYIWVRGQAMNDLGDWGRADDLDRRLFWAIDGALGDGSHVGNCGGLLGCEAEFTRGTGYDGADAQGWNRWRWRRLNDSPIFWRADVTRTLNIWAGGSGFALDRIVITTDPNGRDNDPPSGPIEWNDERGAQEWANGRTGNACHPCDARFAGHPGQSGYVDYSPNCDIGANPDRRSDDIYDDEQPIRASIEAAKRFVSMLDPRHDQVGYVRYSSGAEIGSELECLRRRGDDCNAQVITDTVMAALDSTQAGGGTNIAGGMLHGIAVLSTGTQDACESGGHCGRPVAAHVMIVMTDGRANARPNDYCAAEDLWPDQPGETDAQRQARDCVIYYAQEARDNTIVVYTITLGSNADFELMAAVADITSGAYLHAELPEDLDKRFDEVYERIFLRLVE